jgi:hypothetical protein
MVTEVDFDDAGNMINISEYELSLTYFPRTGLIVLSITVLPHYTRERTIMMGSAVDRDGQPAARHPDDSEEFYQEWLVLH